MYSTWRICDLKEELKKRGASLRGRKADLVERLECYDKNFNFFNRQCSKSDDEPGMALPSKELFRDINSNTKLPPLNKTHLRHYLSFSSKKMDQVVQLYESRHLVAARAYNFNNYTYVKGLCRKTMKSLHYECNVKIDQYGNIEEAHCECPAGSGKSASCKHVAILLMGVEHMVNKEVIILFETCTQRLQQFHVPRNPYSGTPVRAEKMKRKKQSNGIIFEAYPISKINKQNYNNRLRNLVLNFPNSTMPIKQMFEPANPYALESDHDYSSTINPQAKKLEDLLISTITQDQIELIEKSTRGQRSCTEWRNQRKLRITASNFHTLCHLKTSTAPCYAKQMLMQKTFQSRATKHGILNESIALKKYCDNYDISVIACGLFVSKEKPYLAASPDGLIGPDTVLEIKCPYASRFQQINSTTVPYLTPELTIKTTSPCYYQVQGQMYCTDRKFCILVVYTYNDLKVIHVNRNDTFIQNMLLKLDNFYESYFKRELLNKHLYYNYDSYKK